MLLQLVQTRRKQVIIDINTQKHMMLAQGRACIRNHRRVLSHVRRMMAWARTNEVPVISTCGLYVNDDGKHIIKADCHKVSYTLHPNRISFTADNTTDIPGDMLHRYRQAIFEQRTPDPFAEPRIDRLLTEMDVAEFVVMGATAEGAVQATVLGLLQRHKNVTVISDAVGARDLHEAKMALRKMEAKGASMVETKKIAGISHLNLVGACGCDSCLRINAKTAPQNVKSTETVGATQSELN